MGVRLWVGMAVTVGGTVYVVVWRGVLVPVAGVMVPVVDNVVDTARVDVLSAEGVAVCG